MTIPGNEQPYTEENVKSLKIMHLTIALQILQLFHLIKMKFNILSAKEYNLLYINSANKLQISQSVDEDISLR